MLFDTAVFDVFRRSYFQRPMAYGMGCESRKGALTVPLFSP